MGNKRNKSQERKLEKRNTRKVRNTWLVIKNKMLWWVFTFTTETGTHLKKIHQICISLLHLSTNYKIQQITLYQKVHFPSLFTDDRHKNSNYVLLDSFQAMGHSIFYSNFLLKSQRKHMGFSKHEMGRRNSMVIRRNPIWVTGKQRLFFVKCEHEEFCMAYR